MGLVLLIDTLVVWILTVQNLLFLGKTILSFIAGNKDNGSGFTSLKSQKAQGGYPNRFFPGQYRRHYTPRSFRQLCDHFFADKKSLMASRTLGEYKMELKAYGFVTIHHKHLINVRYVLEYNKGKMVAVL